MKNKLLKDFSKSSLKKDIRLSSIRVAGLFIGFGLQVFFTKAIGAKEYGLYVLFTTWASFFSLLLILGYDKFITKHLSYFYLQRKEGKLKAVLSKLLLHITTHSLIFLLLAFLIPHAILINSFFPSELLRSSWLIIAVGTVFFTFYEVLGRILTAVQKVELNFFRKEVLQKCLWFFSVLVLFFWFRDLIGINIIVLGVVIAQVMTLFLLYLHIGHSKIKTFWLVKKEQLSPSRENYIFFFTSLNYFLIAQVDKLFIGKYESLETLGVYGLVVTLISIVSFSTILYHRFTPKISNYILSGNFAELEKDFKTVSKNSLLIALPFIMFLLVFTNDVLLFFGERFTSGTLILRVLIWGQLSSFLTGPNGSVLTNGGSSKIDFANSIFIAIITVGLVFSGYHYFGVVGIAAATSIGLVLINIAKVVELKLLFNIFPYELENFILLIITFLSFYSVSLLEVDIDNLLIRLFINFSLSLAAASVPISGLYHIKKARRLMFKEDFLKM